MYLVKDAVDEILLWSKRLGGNTLLNRPIAKRHLSEAIREMYNFALAAESTFYLTRLPFGTTTNLAYPVDHRASLLVECTDADCVSGFARPVDHKDWTVISNSSTSGPTADDPVFVHRGTGILIAPARSGNLFYLRTIGDVLDDSLDLEDYLPFLWLEPLILKTLEISRLRTTGQGELPSASEKGLRMVDLAYKSLKSSMQTLKLFQQEVPDTPAIQ